MDSIQKLYRARTDHASHMKEKSRREGGQREERVFLKHTERWWRDHTEMTRVTHWYSSKCHEDRWTSVLEFSHRTKDFTAQKLKPVGHDITLSTFSNHNTRVRQRYRDSDTVGDRLFYWVTTLLSAIHQDEPVDVSGFTSGYKMLLKESPLLITHRSDILHANTSQICIKSWFKASTKLLPVHVYFSTI